MIKYDFSDLYSRADWYDIQHADYKEDLEFYRWMVEQTGDPVLELACGTGRITIDLASRGHSMTGLDVSASMLACAGMKTAGQALNIEWVAADATDFDLARKFKLIFFPFNSICHIHERCRMEGLFRCVRAHLDRDARFVVAMFVPNPRYLYRDPSKRYPVSRFVDSEGQEIVITESNRYDPVTQINHIEWFYSIIGKAGEIRVENNMRMYYPREFQALLHYNGLAIDVIYGDYNREPFTGASRMQIYVTRLSSP